MQLPMPISGLTFLTYRNHANATVRHRHAACCIAVWAMWSFLHVIDWARACLPRMAACLLQGQRMDGLTMHGCCEADWIWQLTSTIASAGSGERSAPMLMRLLLWTGSRPAL